MDESEALFRPEYINVATRQHVVWRATFVLGLFCVVSLVDLAAIRCRWLVEKQWLSSNDVP
jgi:hypothetical protein